jgi:hypothetical protein
VAAPTLVSTAQATNANAYAALASAQTYFDGRLDKAEWEAAATATHDAALIMATTRLDLEEWVGGPATSAQRLQWPRHSVPDPWGSYYGEDTNPRPVKEACYELALMYIKEKISLDDTGLEVFANVKTGPLDVTPRIGRKGDALPSIVRRLLKGILVGASDVNTPLEKG